MKTNARTLGALCVALFAAAAVVACVGDDSSTVDGGPDADFTGTAGHACYANGTCDVGLSCISGVCVELDAGNDANAPDATDADAGLDASDGGHLWTWMGGNPLDGDAGDGGGGSPGVYGTMGIASASNIPGSRYSAAGWTAKGSLWLFGGWGYDVASTTGFLDDLWKLDGTTWTWVHGSNAANASPVYGTRGVADTSNTPGAREPAATWTDAAGRLWLFGGHTMVGGDHVCGDLWKFDGASWTWVGGSTTPGVGSYGALGVASATNVPGARLGSTSWTDPSGNAWVFGGYGYASSGSGYLSDLWKFDGTNWTWIAGSSAASQQGVYGTRGVAAPGQYPGGRHEPTAWTDTAGNLWLFGGYGDGANGQGFLNDLWKFDGTNWTWVAGSNSVNQAGTYGTLGIRNASNVPGARRGATGWTDASGKMWLFGGEDGSGHWDDLWNFDGTGWAWVGGSSNAGQAGVYGTLGAPAATNVPGGRYSATGWVAPDGNFWLLGGQAQTSVECGNDLWRYAP